MCGTHSDPAPAQASQTARPRLTRTLTGPIEGESASETRRGCRLVIGEPQAFEVPEAAEAERVELVPAALGP